MSKQLLTNSISEIEPRQFSWSLYFFSIDRRSANPYKIYKVRFKKPQYLTDYAQNMTSAILRFQIENISDVKSYNGVNTKISCDKISLENELIKTQWGLMKAAIVNSSEHKLDSHIMGYILEGQSATPGNESGIIFIKASNPIIKLESSKSFAYKEVGDELDIITDDMYRLFLTTDCIILKDSLYAFNHSFEKIFNLEKAMKKMKSTAINKILATKCFSNSDCFQQYANSYSSARTFLTLDEQRVEKISTPQGIAYIASLLNIKTDEAGKLCVTDNDKAIAVIKYLCFKIFKDDESKDLLEVSNAVRVGN